MHFQFPCCSNKSGQNELPPVYQVIKNARALGTFTNMSYINWVLIMSNVEMELTVNSTRQVTVTATNAGKVTIYQRLSNFNDRQKKIRRKRKCRSRYSHASRWLTSSSLRAQTITASVGFMVKSSISSSSSSSCQKHHLLVYELQATTLGTDTVPGWQHGSKCPEEEMERVMKQNMILAVSNNTMCMCVKIMDFFFYKFCKLRVYKINQRSIIWLFPIIVSFHTSFQIFHTIVYSQPNPWYDKYFIFPIICIQKQVWNMHWDPGEVTMIALIRPMPVVCMEYMYLQF